MHIFVFNTTYVYTTNVTIRLEDEIKQPKFGDEHGKTIINVFVTADRLSNITNGILKPFGISKEQFNVLRILRGQYPKTSTLSLISDRMISKSSNATRLVEKLRQKDLVERSQCEENRRQVDIVITKSGLKLLKDIDPAMIESGKRTKRLTVAESKELNRLLDKMRG